MCYYMCSIVPVWGRAYHMKSLTWWCLCIHEFHWFPLSHLFKTSKHNFHLLANSQQNTYICKTNDKIKDRHHKEERIPSLLTLWIVVPVGLIVYVNFHWIEKRRGRKMKDGVTWLWNKWSRQINWKSRKIRNYRRDVPCCFKSLRNIFNCRTVWSHTSWRPHAETSTYWVSDLGDAESRMDINKHLNCVRIIHLYRWRCLLPCDKVPES